MAMSPPLSLYVLEGSVALGAAVAERLGIPRAPHEERDFEDGEHKSRPLAPVAGTDAYVLHGLYGEPGQSANDKLCRLLFFIAALKDAGAARVTAVTPYLCYARKDRRTKPNDPVTMRYVAQMFEAVGTNAVVALDIHNDAAFENAFRCRTVALTSAPTFTGALGPFPPDRRLCVISPDLGGGKRADVLRMALEQSLGRPVGTAFAEKRRSGGVVSGDLFVGDVMGATGIVVDDLISTGGTVLRAARAARLGGAQRVVVCAGHGLFSEGAEALWRDPAVDEVLVTDSVPPRSTDPKLRTVSVAPLLAEAIHRLHVGQRLDDIGGL